MCHIISYHLVDWSIISYYIRRFPPSPVWWAFLSLPRRLEDLPAIAVYRSDSPPSRLRIELKTFQFPPNMLCHIILYYIISCHIILYPIISYHILLYHVISYHIILHPIISYHILLYHVISTTAARNSSMWRKIFHRWVSTITRDNY